MPHLSSPSGADPTAKEMRNAAAEFADIGRGLECVVETLELLALVIECLRSKINATERAVIDEALRLLAAHAAELRGEVEQPPTIESVLAEALALSKQVRKAVK